MKQFLLPSEPGLSEPFNPENPGILQGKNHHYLVHVRRYRSGDSFPAISPSGRHFIMELLEVRRDSCTYSLVPVSEKPGGRGEVLLRITLMPAVTRGKKIDLTVRQAVEAGASAVWPILTEHSQVRFQNDADRSEKAHRWIRIAGEALQQCGGTRPTDVEPPVRMADALERWNHRGPLLFLHERKTEDGNPGSLHGNLAAPGEELAIIVGPEGGLSVGETRQLTEYGARPIFLGDRVLRAETAALYVLAAAGTIIRERAEWQPM